jgi:D-alanyl-D-alanine carboxypeptidase
MMRATFHLALLLLLGAMTLTNLGARWGGEPASPALAAPVAAATPAAPAGSIVSSLTNPPTASGLIVGAAAETNPNPEPQAPPAVVLPPRPTRQWIQNFRPTELFDGPGPDAASLGTASQFRTFELLEQVDGGRSRLFDPGVGEGRLPTMVWANVADFGPVGAPKTEFELAKGGDVNASSGRRAPDRVTMAWPVLPTAEGVSVVDGDSGAALYGKNPHERLAPASLTKIMTAIVAVENGRLDDRITVDVDSNRLAATTESTVMGLMPGQTVTLETLLYGLMLPSGNDAAIAIARHIGGSEQRFVQMMNDKARALGLQDTQFKNPHGLDVDGHYSSAYDLAAMSRYGMQNPTFYNLAVARHWTGDGFELWNLNRLLGLYPGADGVKVGFTDNAGRCLVGSAVRDNHRVVVAVLRSMDPTGETRALLDYSFNGFRWQ